MEDVQKQVQAGIAFLDERLSVWKEHIDVDRLDMSYPRCCILGQLAPHIREDYSYYSDVCDYFRLTHSQCVSLGFFAVVSDRYDEDEQEHLFDELTDTWKKELAK